MPAIKWMLHFEEKCGKSREFPVGHDLEHMLFEHIEAAGLRNARKDVYIFRTAERKTGRLTPNSLYVIDACRMVKRRLKDASLPTRLSPHSLKKKATTIFRGASLTISINKLFNQSQRRTMKNNIFTFAAIGCMAGIFLAGCGKTPEQRVEGAKQELKDAKADYLAEWQRFKAESEEQIKANEDRIDAFKEKMEKAGTKTKAMYNQEVVELEQKNRDLKKQLEEYKDEGESKWQEFKTNFSHDMDAVGKTMKDLFKDND